MRNLYKVLTLAAVPALVLSACNNPAATGSPNGALPIAQNALRSHDTSAADLHAGGATFPAYAYNLGSQPVGTYTSAQPGPGAGSLFASAGTTGKIYYCLTGSGFGKKVFDGATPANSTAPCAELGQTATGFGGRQDPPDFIGSDQALLSTEYEQYRGAREGAHGAAFEFPAIAGPIVFGYRSIDFPAGFKGQTGKLQLSRWTYCAIANGTVSDWNDPAITADNGNTSITGGVSQPITFYYRTDGSGTSYLFQHHLSTVCGSSWKAPYNAAPYQGAGRNAAWTYGYGTKWQGPNTGHFIGENGNPGVLAAIQAQTFSTGYVEGAWAQSATNPSVEQAVLLNGRFHWADPTNAAERADAVKGLTAKNISFDEGADYLPLDSPRPKCILFLNPFWFANPTGVTAYPIVGVSYLMFYGKANAHYSDDMKLIKFMTSSAANAIVQKLEYTPLPTAIQNLAAGEAQGGSKYGKACVNP